MSDRFSSTSLHPEHPEQPGQGPVFSVPRGNRILAIDGPAGAGKSTIANRMARRFNLLNLETGAMYRAFALKAIQGRTALDHEAELIRRTAIACCSTGKT
jgi:cytidylate kinase